MLDKFFWKYEGMVKLTPSQQKRLSIAYQHQLINQILLWSFLRLLVMLILVQLENEQGQVDKFQDTI